MIKIIFNIYIKTKQLRIFLLTPDIQFRIKQNAFPFKNIIENFLESYSFIKIFNSLRSDYNTNLYKLNKFLSDFVTNLNSLGKISFLPNYILVSKVIYKIPLKEVNFQKILEALNELSENLSEKAFFCTVEVTNEILETFKEKSDNHKEISTFEDVLPFLNYYNKKNLIPKEKDKIDILLDFLEENNIFLIHQSIITPTSFLIRFIPFKGNYKENSKVVLRKIDKNGFDKKWKQILNTRLCKIEFKENDFPLIKEIPKEISEKIKDLSLKIKKIETSFKENLIYVEKDRTFHTEFEPMKSIISFLKDNLNLLENYRVIPLKVIITRQKKKISFYKLGTIFNTKFLDL